MRTRKIWRVEDRERGGPYRTDCAHQMDEAYLAARKGGDGRTVYEHPGPRDNGERGSALYRQAELPLHDPLRGWVFGFATLKQYRAWFFSRHHARVGSELGFSLVRYRVPAVDVVDGHHQLIFRPESAVEVERRAL